MTRYQFVGDGEPASLASTVMTRLFDLLLVGGYAACIVLTYLLVVGPAAPTTVPAATPRPAPAVAAATPAAAQPATVTPTPEAAPSATTEAQDLIDAMNAYLAAINAQEYAQAVALRADPDVPQLDKLKKIKSMTATNIVPYPRIARDRGSLYVELIIEKTEGAVNWKGRIDFEKRGGKWVMVKWDSKAQKPSASTASAAPASTPKPAASPTPKPKPAASPTPKPTPAPAAAASPTPKPQGDTFDFSFSGSH